MLQCQDDWYHWCAAAVTGSARSHVVVPTECGSQGRGYYLHLGLVT